MYNILTEWIYIYRLDMCTCYIYICKCGMYTKTENSSQAVLSKLMKSPSKAHRAIGRLFHYSETMIAKT